MTKLEKLKKIWVEDYKLGAFNNYNGAVDAVKEVFGYGNTPYIYKDDEGNASHIFFENQVLFFSGDLYSS